MLKDGKHIDGESNIGVHRENNGIDYVYLTPERPKAVSGVISAIKKADVIVLGPGSLYTSIIPNLLVDGVTNAIKKSSAIKVYVCNIMSQAGETEGYTLSDHLEAIERHSYRGIADIVIANNAVIPESLKIKYAAEYAHMVPIDADKITDRCSVLQGNLLLVKNEKIRHNFSRLSRTIIQAAKTRR